MPAPTTNRPHLLCLLSIVTLVALLTACGHSTAEQLASSRPTTAVAEVAAAPAPTAAPAATEAPAPTAVPTFIPEPPTATPEPLVDPVIQASGFAQDGQRLGFGVAIENPNAGAALEEVSMLPRPTVTTRMPLAFASAAAAIGLPPRFESPSLRITMTD